MKNLFSHSVPIWKFWDPQSGLAGGLILGTLIFLIIFAVVIAHIK